MKHSRCDHHAAHNVGLSPSTLSNGNSAADADEDNARSNNAGQQQEEIPIEYQTYECDEVSQMDPLEYTFRKFIPIPRVYFWDNAVTSSGSVQHDTNNLPRRIKLWHYTIYYLGEGLKIAEKGGEVVANTLGLNDGPFDYVTSGMTAEEMLASRAMMNERRQREELEEMTRNDEGGV